MTDLSFIELKKLSKTQVDGNAATLFLAGDCATQHLATAIKGYGVHAQVPMKVFDADYDLIDAMILDGNSALYACRPDFVLLFMCAEKLQEKFSEFRDKSKFADHMIQSIRSDWAAISSRCNAKILQFSYIEYDDAVFGSYALKSEESFLFQVKKLNYYLASSAQNESQVFLVDLNGLRNNAGSRFRDDKLYYIAKMPISLEFLPETAKRVIDVINAINGTIKKCVVCDLDNTLWGGVIGDDGLSGIQIGELGLGHAFEDLQRWLKSLKERGIILAICSKNEEGTAKEPFIKHPEMVLRLEDISIFVANWQDKASNIRQIQKALNIGMDSIVFLDDNPFERQLVRTMIPELTVPELPEDPAEYLSYLMRLNLFETASCSQADKQRTEQYQAEAKRVQEQAQYTSYEDYLKNLHMLAEALPFDEYQIPRIAQLTQRSNQFNLRTVRCTEDEIRSIMKNSQYLTRYYKLEDKFGDHGVISVAILKMQDAHTLFIENWLMSCRVLKRGMEEFIINDLVALARENGFTSVLGEYVKTPKNAMVSGLYSELGFTPIGEGRYLADTAHFIARETLITSKIPADCT